MTHSILETIRTRGYWHVTIRPTVYKQRRFKHTKELKHLIERAGVALGGWGFPRIDIHNQWDRNADYVGQSIRLPEEIETWRFHKSGQFVSIRGIKYDWRDASRQWPKDEKWKSGQCLSIGDVLFTVFGFIELAARLSEHLSNNDHSPLFIRIRNSGPFGRLLVLEPGIAMEQPLTALMWDEFRLDEDDIVLERTCQPAELMSNSAEIATQFAARLFGKFGFDASESYLAELRSRLRC